MRGARPNNARASICQPTHRLSQELDASRDGSHHGVEPLGGTAAALEAAVATIRDLARPTSIFQAEVRAIPSRVLRDQRPAASPAPLPPVGTAAGPGIPLPGAWDRPSARSV